MDLAGLVRGIFLGLCFLLVANSKKQLVPSQEDDGPSTSWLEDTGTEVLVQGSWMKTRTNKTFASFQGIPYASPPVGSKRFLRPEAVKYNTSLTTIDARGIFKTACPQPGVLQDSTKSEDCLYLNVHTFEGGVSLRPVMVFIHGGAFHSGDGTWGSFGPQHFLDQDVIVVTLNYRLGALGFLSLGSAVMPGNMGLWDQNTALRWVQEHIVYFGGDPDQVTVFGESAGSWALLYHLVSRQSDGLFQKMIGESGSPLSDVWGFISSDQAAKNGQMFAEKVGCHVAELTCFQNLPLEALLNLNRYLDDPTDHPAFITGNPWNGVVDLELTDDPFLADSPLNILKNGDFNKEIEIILGANQDEGLLDTVVLYLYPELYEAMSSNWDHYGPLSVLGRTGLGDISQADKEISTKILEFYTDSADNLSDKDFPALTEMKTDATFWHGIDQTVSLLAGHGVSVYQYIFSYRGEHSYIDAYGVQPGLFGVCHADELFYLFDPLYHLDLEDLPSSDRSIRELLVSSWTSFAKYGDPSPPGSGISWTPVAVDSRLYLNISGTHPVMERSQDYQNRMQFWSTVMED